MGKMLRKNIGQTHTCMYGEKCCAPFPLGGRSGSATKKLQRRVARRREEREWKRGE